MAEQGAFNEQAFGRYRLLARLGEGGMAEVFKAKSFGVEGFEKVVVIKRILPRLARYKSFVDMFVHEAKLAVRLSHANIVQVFDLGRVEPTARPGQALEPPSYFMAMEYVAGLDLATMLERCRQAGLQPPPGLGVYVVGEVAKGLDHAHRRRDDSNQPLGIVHRDVSPHNILLSWEGEVKVTDFGIAKARDSLEEAADDSRVRMIRGKYAYMSPEQARSEPVEQRSDLFSLGAVLYEILAGTNPFRGAQPLETLQRVREAEFPPLEAVCQDIPAPLAALVARAMAPRPEDRFPDAARMYEQLLSFSYASGARFGAADLAEFLQRVRVLPASPSGTVPSPHAITPVEIPGSPLSLDEAAPPSAGLSPGSVTSLREVTVLCLSARHRTGGHALEELPRELHERAAALCARHGGQPLGDGSLAVFGLGEADLRDTEHAVRCAMSLLRGHADPRLQLGVGVHVGRLRVDATGGVAHDESSEPLLSQAQALAETAGRVVLSTEAARQVSGVFSVEPAGGGLAVTGARSVQEAYGKFIGRRDELAQLGTWLATAAKRQLQLISVAGPAGVGKTRLLHETDRRLRRGDFNVGFYVAPCTPRGHETPLSGVTAMLQVLCGVQDGDEPDRARHLEPSLRALGLLDDEVDAVLAQLGVPNLDAEGPQTLRSAFLKTLLSLAEDRVHVFAWDNAHWLDPASIQLLSSSLRRLASARVALVFAGREGFSCPLRGAHPPQHIEMGELSEPDARRLIASRLGLAEPPPELLDFCLRRAGGHPLFLEELLRDLLDAGAIQTEDGAVTRLDLGAQPSVPRPLRAIMAGRVARLPALEQAALQAAAVLGEAFDAEVVLGLLGGGDEARALLSSLETRELIYPTSDDRCTFASPMMREVVIDALPPDTRRDLHERAALALERTDAPPERIAEHLVEAGQHHSAGLLLARSCRLDLEARRYESAVADALHALGLLDLALLPASDLLALLHACAVAFDRVRVAPGAPGLLADAIDELDQRATVQQRAEARLDIATSLFCLAHFDDALRLLDEATQLDPEPSFCQRVWIVEARLHLRRGDFQKSLAAIERARARALDPDLERRSLGVLAQCYGVLGEREQALTYLDQLPPPHDPTAAAEVEKLRALVLYFARDFAASSEASARAVELARQADLTYEVALNLHNLADSLIFLGDLPRAYAALLESLSLCEQYGADLLASGNRMFLGYLDAMRGLPGGETLLRNGIAQAEAQGYGWNVVSGRYLLGRLFEELGMPGSATAEYEACKRVALDTRNPFFVQECDAASARCRAAQG